jgi:hypothetical protein
MHTDVGTHTQAFRCDLTAIAALLASVVSRHSDNLRTSTLSLELKDTQELCPSCVINAFTQVMVLDHTLNVQVFHHDGTIAVDISFGNVEMEVTSLPFYLQVRLGNVASGFCTALAALLTTAPGTLLPTL